MPRYLLIVFALAGDSTIIRFFAMYDPWPFGLPGGAGGARIIRERDERQRDGSVAPFSVETQHAPGCQARHVAAGLFEDCPAAEASSRFFVIKSCSINTLKQERCVFVLPFPPPTAPSLGEGWGEGAGLHRADNIGERAT